MSCTEARNRVLIFAGAFAIKMWKLGHLLTNIADDCRPREAEIAVFQVKILSLIVICIFIAE